MLQIAQGFLKFPQAILCSHVGIALPALMFCFVAFHGSLGAFVNFKVTAPADFYSVSDRVTAAKAVVIISRAKCG